MIKLNFVAATFAIFAANAEADTVTVGPELARPCIGIAPCPPFHGALRDQFPDIYGDGVRLRLVVMPSFSSSYAVALAATPAGWRVLYRRNGSFGPWWSKQRLMAPRCDAPIDGKLAERLVRAWTRLITEVIPYERERIGLDGTTFEFSMTANGGDIGAQEWSPEGGTPPAILVDAANDAAAYCAGTRHWWSTPARWHYTKTLSERLDAFDRAVAGLPHPHK